MSNALKIKLVTISRSVLCTIQLITQLSLLINKTYTLFYFYKKFEVIFKFLIHSKKITFNSQLVRFLFCEVYVLRSKVENKSS